ncbi:unnamed protein product [Linum tenue]|uniref:DRBM domain-containing protein n=1 Tax=Linum tenue TaxID=586396 RepID=A0AAV0HJQ7_9ROSI|nr:unnamed protein product [Linum tenue]
MRDCRLSMETHNQAEVPRSPKEEMGYKNLLQEFAQKKCFLLPIYVTTRAGEVHAPTFISTVEVNQQVFTGQEARTKKLAEMSAAKTAYTHLKEGNSNQSAAGPVAAGQEQELCLPTPKVDSGLLAHLNQNFQPKLHPVAASKEQKLVSSSPQVELGLLVHPNQNIGPELLVPSEKVGHAGVAEPSTIDPGSFSNKTISKIPSPSPGSPSLSNLQEETADSGTVVAGTNPLVIHPSPDSTEVVKNLPASHPAASPCFIPSVTDAGGVVDSDSSIQHQKGLNPGLPASISLMPSATLADDRSYSGISGLIKSSIGLPNRIVIHPRNISLTYPPGSTVLPVSDSNWVAVSSSSQSTL